jgi:cytochrome c oxidase subunit III
MSDSHSGYYLPDPSHWPLVGSIGLFSLFGGFAMYLNGSMNGLYVMAFGFIVMVVMLFGWFGKVIGESEGGKYNEQVDRSFRWSMGWFIFSEVMFFAAFFGALYYIRMYSVPWLGGDGVGVATHQYLWPKFQAVWPLLKLPNTKTYVEAKEAMEPWGLPSINTLILLTSGATVTWAHWGLKNDLRRPLIIGLLLTVVLGFTFVVCQALEYGHAYHELNLKLGSGVYGSTFFMLTGFHGFHVTMGAIMLTVILFRCLRGHFSAEHHFAFEAVAWYWHFVDVVWLGLFIFVYWL